MNEIVAAATLIGLGLTFLALAVYFAANTIAKQQRRAEERRMRAFENFSKRALELMEPQTPHTPSARREEDE